MSISFYYMRHAQSEANKAAIMCGGGIDTPLSDNGLEQVKYVRDVLLENPLKTPPCTIIHTGMRRTLKTASIVNQALNLSMVAMPHLKEHEVGAWEGKPWHEIDCLFLDRQDPPNGEKYIHFQKRILSAMGRVFDQFHTPFIVAHGGVFKAFQDGYGVPQPSVMNNAVIYYLEYDPILNPFKWHIQEVCAPCPSILEKQLSENV